VLLLLLLQWHAASLKGLIAGVLGLGTLNRVLYRLALVPLRDYVFFLAQAQNIGYLVIYYSLLFIRYRCSGPQQQQQQQQQLAQSSGSCRVPAPATSNEAQVVKARLEPPSHNVLWLFTQLPCAACLLFDCTRLTTF
jgi:hypothetical protein